MSVTGHKCETSLKTYTGTTDSKTKKLMSETITKNLLPDKNDENDDATLQNDFLPNFDMLSESDFDDLLTVNDNTSVALLPNVTNVSSSVSNVHTASSVSYVQPQVIPNINNYGTLNMHYHF